jgi:hypothetical protein
MIAHNENSRNEIGYPEELGSFAERWFVNKTMESLKGAM